jgi:ribosome hibernation promoting factor
MNINITSRKFKAKDSLKEFITDEINSLEKFHDGILDVDVILSYIHEKNSIKTAEIIVKITGKTLNVSEDSEEFTKSINIGIDKLKRVLKKEKQKRMSK